MPYPPQNPDLHALDRAQPVATALEVEAHVDWLQGLARALVRDPEAAEDLAQETLLAALRSRQETAAPRAWLATVLRRQLADRIRSSSRAMDRERDAAVPDHVAGPLGELERNSVREVVATELAGLPEAYRSVLRRRYVDGLTPTQIAAASGDPIATVKTRLQRGLERMRERLDARHGGDGRSWVAALAPIAFPKDAARSLASGTTAGSSGALTWFALVAAAGLAALGGWALFQRSDSTQHRSALEPRSETTETLADAAAPPSSLDKGTRRDLSAVAVDPGAEDRAVWSALPPLAIGGAHVTGRVVDPTGQPLANVPVVLDAPASKGQRGTAVALSTAGGEFELRDAAGAGLLRALGTRTTVASTRVTGDRRAGHLVVVDEARELAGRVVDERGEPIPGAYVAWRSGPLVMEELAEALAAPGLLPREAETDRGGEFTLEVPGGSIERGALEVAASGYVSRSALASDATNIVLEPDPNGRFVVGKVVAADGSPAAAARIGLGPEITRANDAGEFRLALPDHDGPLHLRAVAHDAGSSQPASLEIPDGTAPHLDDGSLVLQLGPPPVALEGRVVDTAGHPLAGYPVWIDDPTPLHLAAEDEERSLEIGRRFPGEERARELAVFVEALAEGKDGGRAWRPVWTDSDGRFRLTGLSSRPYRLAVMNPHTLVAERFVGRSPTDEARLVFDGGDVWPQVAGRVLDERGVPVAGARVSVASRVIECQGFGTLHFGAPVTTDDTGHFVLRHVPRARAAVRVEGYGLVPVLAPLESPESAREIQVARHARLQIEVALSEDAGGPVEVSLLDDAGLPLSFHVIEGARRETLRSEVVRGRATRVLHVPLSAAIAVLSLRGEELGREPLALRPGALTTLRAGESRSR